MTDIIDIQHVRVQLGGIDVLEDVTLKVPPGDFVALIGQNGAGKTTLIKILLGLIRPQDGQARLFGQPIAEFKEWHRISYVPQHVARVEGFPVSVEEVVSLGRVSRRGLFRFLTVKDHEAIHAALATVGIANLQRRRVDSLSGGQRQRVFIARALASEPDLLVLDEPTAGVDPGTQAELYEFLGALNEARGLTILLASHDLGALMRRAKTVACINKRLISHRPATEGLTEKELVEVYGSPFAVVTHTH
jgi:zinc transport system ATP-binding protein